MSMLQLNQAGDAGTAGKDTVLPALRAGIDGAAAFALADNRAPRRRRTLNRLRQNDQGLRPFRVF